MIEGEVKALSLPKVAKGSEDSSGPKSEAAASTLLIVMERFSLVGFD